MAIDKESLDHLEDSLVHEAEDEDPTPTGKGIYLTPKFLGLVTLLSYGFMILLVLIGDLIFSGDKIPVVLLPGSLAVALPFAVVGLYMLLTGRDEKELKKQRTTAGRIVTFAVTYVVLQILTTASWIGLTMAFTLK